MEQPFCLPSQRVFLFVLCEKQEAICLFSLDNLMKEDNASEGNDSRTLVKWCVFSVGHTDGSAPLLSQFVLDRLSPSFTQL